MGGLKRRNPVTGGILFFTLVLNGDVVDREYILHRLQQRGITTVKGPKPKDGEAEDIDVSKWLHHNYGGTDRNYGWLLFWMTIFCNIRWSRERKDADYQEYINIHSDFWDQYIDNNHGLRTIIENILEAAEVIKINPIYLSKTAAAKVGKKPFPQSFSICEKEKFTTPPTYKSVVEFDTTKWIANDRWITNKTDFIPIKGDLETTQAIISNLQKIRLCESVLEDIETYNYEAEAERVNVVRKKRGEKPTSPERLKQSDLSTMDTILSFAGLNQKDFEREVANSTFTYRVHTGRVYHSFITFPKRWRHKLSIKGAPIYQIDCVGAHPYLLIQLYDNMKAAPLRKEREKKRYNTRFSHNSDFYTTVGKLGGIEKSSPDQSDANYRGMIKDMFWLFLYGKHEEVKDSAFAVVYRENYQLLFDAITDWKTNLKVRKNSATYKHLEKKLKELRTGKGKADADKLTIKDVLHTQFNLRMSQLEGDIMIKTVCRRLVHEGIEIKGKNIVPWFIPFHDGIWVQVSTIKPIKQLVKAVWKEKTNARPAFSDGPIG